MQHAALARRLRHVRAPSPLHFPEEALVPETKRHLEIRTLLYVVLKTFADRASIGSDQFVYWSASDPSRCLAPDAFVRLDTPDTPFGSWKTWERGAPELAVEIVSEHDSDPQTWADKLRKYHELGVLELVAFDPDAAPGERLRVWDRIDDDLIERVVEGERSPCTVLDLHWVIAPAAGQPAALRLARTPDGAELVPTPEEAARRRAEAEQARAEAEQAARATAERRIAELEAELRRRGG
ncbi:Uma2 family endonuclease [Sorangium sp. So ce295]|jgi:Uma2 family endonuclease|uniref:Uma2 family endonuclease n=1 Tax=Sorangium sp. So ce295 TaxID=3133295 RepID=UPI003F62528E